MVHEGGTHPDNTVTITGPHSGDLRAEVVNIGQAGSVAGRVVARTVKCAGRIEGDVDAQVFYAAATARILGTVRYETIGLMPGCVFEGSAVPAEFAAFERPAVAEVAEAAAEAATKPAELASAPVAPAAEERSVGDLPFRPGPKGIMWVPGTAAAAASQGRDAPAQPAEEVLTEERRAKMMENLRVALSAVETSLVQPVQEPVRELAAPAPVGGRCLADTVKAALSTVEHTLAKPPARPAVEAAAPAASARRPLPSLIS